MLCAICSTESTETDAARADVELAEAWVRGVDAAEDLVDADASEE